jgi:pentatricopeptide repeat protein
VYTHTCESLDAVAVRPDTMIANAAISACDKGGQWEKALQIFSESEQHSCDM